MSDVDFEFLYGGSDCGERAKSLIASGASLVVVTRGIKGAQAWHGEAGLVEVQAPAIDVVDTIGAGDSFKPRCCLPARHRTDQDKCAGANEFRRASSGAVIRVDVRGLHMWARRGRSAAPV